MNDTKLSAERIREMMSENNLDGLDARASIQIASFARAIEAAVLAKAEPETMTATELADRIQRGEKWSVAAQQDASAAQAVPDEREAFEAWLVEATFCRTDRMGHGDYQDHNTRVAWEAWQTRAALAQPSEQAQLWTNTSDALPKYYQEVYAKHRDGSVRIARLSKGEGGYWQLATFLASTTVPGYAWGLDEVVEWCAIAAQQPEDGVMTAGELARRIERGERWKVVEVLQPTSAPGHTDLMVSPEALDEYLRDNPPSEPAVRAQQPASATTGPDDGEVRAAFSAVDQVSPMRDKTAWQVWRDAAAWAHARYAAPALPKGEPVAWMRSTTNGCNKWHHELTFEQPPAPPFPALEKVVPLYTAPVDAAADTQDDDTLTIAYMAGVEAGKRVNKLDAAIRNAALEQAVQEIRQTFPLAMCRGAAGPIIRAIEALKTDQQEQK